MTDRQQKALNNLWLATHEVMEAFAPETVTADQRREAMTRVLADFFAAIPAAGAPASPTAAPTAAPTADSAPSQTAGPAAVTPVEAAPAATPAPAPVKVPIQILYADYPRDGVFKRPVDEETMKERMADNPDLAYYYKLTVEDEKSGYFEVLPRTDDMEQLTKWGVFDSGVLQEPGGTDPTEATKVETVKPGRIEKTNKWKVTEPATVRFSEPKKPKA